MALRRAAGDPGVGLLASAGSGLKMASMPARRFPETSPSLVSRLSETARHGDGLEQLSQRYWRPVYLYVRAAWSKSTEDAGDLTQAFFLWLIEERPLRSYAPERGSLRAFLKVLLRRFVGHQERALRQLKRGGGARLVSIGDCEPPAAGSETDPERLFDRAWVTEVVTQAVDRVCAQLTEAGSRVAVDVYERYELAPPGARPTYVELAAELGQDVGQVKRHLVHVRDAVRREIRAELRQMTSDDGELEAEWREYFQR